MGENVNFRLEKTVLKRLDDLARAKGVKRSDALREAVKEYLAIYIIAEEPTIGRLHRKYQETEKRLTKLEEQVRVLERLLMTKASNMIDSRGIR